MDASLNNYVALHYASRHMSWLHCMWGVGASLGPYVMGSALTGGKGWNAGYLTIAVLQIGLTAVLFVSLPLWKKRRGMASESETVVPEASPAADTADMGSTADRQNPIGNHVEAPLTLPQIMKIRGAKEIMVTFFCYCALEQTAGLWASSYLVLHRGISAETAAGFASLFFIGITAGRALSGFLTIKFTDVQMIRLGQGMAAAGIAALLLPFGGYLPLVGLVMIGLGCAPIYPCIIHATPDNFGADKSQAVIGVQMASAYVGTCLMPPLFGLIANHISVALLPFYLLLALVLMVVMHETLIRKITSCVREAVYD